jgi:hypothetical protein
MARDGHRYRALIAALPALLLLCGQAIAAPLPPMTPVDLCGKVVSATWIESRTLPARPGFSGSLGRKRVVPDHFLVILRDYTGIDVAKAARMSSLVSAEGGNPAGGRVAILLFGVDRQALLDAETVCVGGYRIAGDEGITLTTHKSLKIVRDH